MTLDFQERLQELISEYLADLQRENTQSQEMLEHNFAVQLSRRDEELSCLRNVQKMTSAGVSARIAHVTTQRNSLLPIHRLPLELLCYILEASLGHFDGTTYPRTIKRLLALTTVSRHWKDVLDQSPSVWGWIDTFRDVSFAVQKSQHAPLSIDLVNEKELDISKLNQGFAPLLPHSGRWQSLHLRMTAPAATHFTYVLGPLSTPNLQDLSLVVYSDDGVLSGISTSWDTVAALTELRSLRIVGLCKANAWPSRDQITNILLGCIHLEELALSCLENNPADVSVPPPPLSTIHLPVLRSLELQEIVDTRQAALWLLDCISTPKLSGLSVTGARFSRRIGNPIASILQRQRIDSPLQAVIASLRGRPVHVHMTQYSCQFDWAHVLKRETHHGLELLLPEITYDDTSQRVIDIVSIIVGDSPLHLHLGKAPTEGRGPNPDPDPDFLLRLPSLSVLRIEWGVRNVEAFLRFLCSRGPGDPAEYCCPNLTEIHFWEAPWSGSEMQREAVNQLKEKRPNIALYDNEGRHFSRHPNDD
ncbi:hypothetical protein FRC00_008407 [Tulasnella sp. 408]|nr:hypothetical protein FRC00_008407 [Tulasnella sp. 408]